MGTLSKILTTGVGAALMTEGSIRNAIADIQLPRQAKGYLAKQVQKGKEELTKVILGELKRFLDHLNIHEEIQKALKGLTIEVSVAFHPASERKRPKARRGK